MNEPSPSHSPNASTPAKHQYQHDVPTVIHDPEQDMTALARWLHRAMQNPSRFWTLVGAGIASLFALVILANVLSSPGRRSSDAWSKLDEARNADDQIELAKANPNSAAAPWALLSAATQLYRSGVDDLPNNADAALQTLKKSLDIFDQLAAEQPKDSPVALAAAFGKARALEARNELPKAIDQYKLVAESWPDSLEAGESKKLAAALQTPEAVAFYKDLYAYTPTKVSLPPLGTESLDFPAVVPAPIDTDAPADGSLVIPPPPPTDATPNAEEGLMEAPEAETPSVEEPKAEEATAEEPQTEASPAEEPKVEEPQTEAPAVEEPKAEEATAEEPQTEAPTAEEPKAEEATAEPAASPEL